ncbi:MAG: aminotransferase class V-fold PLP-dependent enzyme [SAR324 cluster bacterium]|nr:aminotransferase class V-fold PLP-dependent enzyme [SAR324 cluster bacterium]
MSLYHGRHYLAIPGPSVMPDRVLQAMHQAAPNIYEGALHDMVNGMIPDLKRVAKSSGEVAIYICNGHGTWEASLTNTLSRGDKVLALATGRFVLFWAKMAESLGVEVDLIDFGKSSPVDLDMVAARLKADSEHRYKAIMVTQTDTASTARNDIEALGECIRSTGHPALYMVDSMASLGCEPFEMDRWGVDLMVAGSQKGLMTPPGLGFMFFNQRVIEAREKANMVTPYWDFLPRINPQVFYEYFFGTAPTHHLFGLREALTILLEEEGLEEAWARHAKLSRAVWAAFDAWGQNSSIRLNIKNPKFRSHAVTAISMDAPHATELRRWTEKKAGVTLGIGLGMAERTDPAYHGFFRVAHMGHVNAHMTLGMLAVIDAGLKALNIPHGDGALSAASQVVSEA